MKSVLNTLLTLSVMITLSACGAGVEPSLPDETENEPAAITAPLEDAQDSQNTAGEIELPSVSESASEKSTILRNYDHLDPSNIVPTKALEDAVIYFHKNKSSFKNQTVISIIDFSQKSTKKRWYFINMKTGAVWNIHVSHGKGSDAQHDGYAEKFSNVSGSNASSLGYYRTAETYSGSHGLSLRLDGLSSTNSKARPRAIVVHGASYVQDSSVIQGRSWGCPAVSMANRTKVINMIKGGSLIYAVK